jgi:hypothetical protein
MTAPEQRRDTELTRRTAEQPDVEVDCAVCDNGLTLEADAVCAGCGRYGGCPDCAEGDCAHLL